MMKPVIPEITEPAIMPTFAKLRSSGDSKASEPIKRLIVNPIPAKNPMPISCLKFAPVGSAPNFNFTAAIENRLTPSTLPRNNPAAIPSVTPLSIPPLMPPSATPAFARAKTGIMKKATNG